MKGLARTLFVAVGGLMISTSASAQVLGTFRWQFAPYCNVVTARVEQQGALYMLRGTDDGCSASTPAATVNGSAHLNAGGTVGMSLAIVRPDGLTVNAVISLNLATIGGTWRDDWGNTGDFVFNPPPPVSAPPRPLTMRGEWSVFFSGGIGSQSISFRRPLPSAPAASQLNVIVAGGSATANCPGSVGNPQAAPGQVCVYELSRENVVSLRMWSAAAGAVDIASAFGFSITASGGPDSAFSYGTWAASAP